MIPTLIATNGRLTMKPVEAAILIVDDDADMCRNMSDILSDLGYRVDTALEGRSAIRLLERRAYDLALLDLKMPGMNGMALCREVKRLSPRTVALLITGYVEDVLPSEARASGIGHIVAKPVDVPRLLSRIEQAIVN
jgi:CheY-like chemotaxis protein